MTTNHKNLLRVASVHGLMEINGRLLLTYHYYIKITAIKSLINQKAYLKDEFMIKLVSFEQGEGRVGRKSMELYSKNSKKCRNRFIMLKSVCSWSQSKNSTNKVQMPVSKRESVPYLLSSQFDK